jgi:hypothetical protein
MIVDSGPLLSVLIPTCNYRIGLIRILFFLKNIPKNKYEIIIYDNSKDSYTQEYMEKWISDNPHVNLSYRLNQPITQPAENWNNLLNAAKGKYCLLLHNGEFPDRLNFFEKLINNLENKGPDLAIMGCILADYNLRNYYYHFPKRLTLFIIKFFPKYLFRRNIIGPASTLVIKKELYSKFDQHLSWYLDVDSYYCSLVKAKNIILLNDINVISVVNKKDTLTNMLSKQIIQVEKKERVYLDAKYKEVYWNGEKKNIITFSERVLWRVFKFIHKLIQHNLIKKIEASVGDIWKINN